MRKSKGRKTKVLGRKLLTNRNCFTYVLPQIKNPLIYKGFSVVFVVPMGERSYYEVEDFHKILEFTGLLEPLTD